MTWIVRTGLYWSYCYIILPTNDLTPIELGSETTARRHIPPDCLEVSELCVTGHWTSPHPRETPQKFDRLQHNSWSHGMDGSQSPMPQTASIWYVSWSTTRRCSIGVYIWHAIRRMEPVAGSIGALHAPQTLLLRVEHSSMAGQSLPGPVLVSVQTATTTTITSTATTSAAQAGLVYTSYTGLQAPSPGISMVHPVSGTADN